jgi:molecular chaperone GrpE (heat shock protein)
MSDRRKVWATLSDLLSRLERDIDNAQQNATTPSLPSEYTSDGLTALENEVRKLGKTQFKANVVAEKQAANLEKALTDLQAQQAQQAELLEKLVSERIAAERQNWFKTILPVLDGLDQAINSGQKYLVLRDKAAQIPNPTAQQALLVSPADRAKLASWLEGLRLLRDRLLKILDAGEVTPIATVGEPFDPHVHIAVATAQDENVASGTIITEERRGYRTVQGVLRYAEVIVNKREE